MKKFEWTHLKVGKTGNDLMKIEIEWIVFKISRYVGFANNEFINYHALEISGINAYFLLCKQSTFICMILR